MTRLELHRRLAGRTNRDEAKRLKVSAGLLSELQTHQRTAVSPKLQARLERVYGVPFTELLRTLKPADVSIIACPTP